MTITAGTFTNLRTHNPPGDPFFDNVILLTNCEGPDGGTSLTDQSNDNTTINFLDDAQIDTSQSRHGLSSVLFDGGGGINGDCLQMPDDSKWDIGTNDFTIEFDFRLNDRTGTDHTLLDKRNNGSQFGWGMNVSDATGTYVVSFFGWNLGNPTPVINIKTTTEILDDTWYTIAVSRNDGFWGIYTNGTREATGTETGQIGGNNSNVRFGRSSNSNDSYRPMDGWVDNIRVTNGVGRYTESSYVLPTGAYTTYKGR